MNVRFFLLWGIGTFFLMVCDFIWLGVLMKNFYLANIIGMRVKPLLIPAIFVWLLVALGNLIFAVPYFFNTSLAHCVIMGGLYGLIVFGVYNFTNLSLFARWSLMITLTDICWGVFVNACLSLFLRFTLKISIIYF